MAKDRARARKTDGRSLCPGPASPREVRDSFAFYVLFSFCTRLLSCHCQRNTKQNPGPNSVSSPVAQSAASACSGSKQRCNGCLSIAQLSQNVYHPGRICQKVCDCDHDRAISLVNFGPPLVPSLEIWYTFPTKYTVGRRDSHGSVWTSSAAFLQLRAVWKKNMFMACLIKKIHFFRRQIDYSHSALFSITTVAVSSQAFAVPAYIGG